MLKKILKSYDYSLVIVYILLSLFGLVMIYSASMVIAVQWYEYPADFFYQKQKSNLLIAFFAFIFFAIFPYKVLRNKQFLITMMLTAIVGLLLVTFFGDNTNNAQSWIKLGARKLEPSEFVKISIIIYLAAVYSNKQTYINQLNKAVLPPLFYLVFVCFLVAMEPDNGTALIIFLIGLTIIVCSGMSLKTIIKLCSIGVVSIGILTPFIIMKYESIFTDSRMGRIQGYLDPFGTAAKEGYQLVHSYLAIGSGGIKGLGLGQSVQKLGYLPEAHTDFIMAIIAEELGIFGVAFVIICLSYIVLRGLMIGIKCKDPFGGMMAIGIAGMIGIQSFINLGAMSGLIPVTGVTLPFVSYGGSSILVLSISMGILLNISMFNNYKKLNANDPAANPTPETFKLKTRNRNTNIHFR